MQIIIKDTDHIHVAAREFLAAFKDVLDDNNAVKCFAFYAPMGAGKTTFIKAICEELGVEDVITSPTFAIVNEYTAPASQVLPLGGAERGLYHFDFYRIKRMEELYDMGADEYFYSGRPCFMEWPEIVEEALPEETIKITITPQSDGTRIVEF